LNGHEKRLMKLEEIYRVPASLEEMDEPCPECFEIRYPNGYPAEKDTYELIIDGPDEEEMPDEDAYCAGCGELVVGVLRLE
jgi:hypothetical protein